MEVEAEGLQMNFVEEMMMEETKTSDVEKRSEQMGRRKEVNEIIQFLKTEGPHSHVYQNLIFS